jgi:predicted  nucleic acid-binding Zn-ribbon protein
MSRLELGLADWHRQYKELLNAQQRLEQPDIAPSDLAALRAEIDRLQSECDAALSAIYDTLRADKAETGQQPLP